MHKSLKFDSVCKQFGSLKHRNPPMKIDWMPTVAWNLLFERESLFGVCLVYLHVENGVGIAENGKKGYTKTPCFIYDGVDGQKAVDWFNENILELSKKESIEIVLNTMRKQ